MTPAGKSLVFFPAFTLRDAAELTDQFHRVMWYLYPVIDRLAEIVFPVEAGMRPEALPDYLDPSIPELTDAFKPIIRFVAAADLDGALARADYALVWHNADAPPQPRDGLVIEDIDRHNHIEECQTYLNLSSKIGESYSYRVSESHTLFRNFVEKNKTRKCYIFGTGPSLSQVHDHDFSDGVAVACNSMVRNLKLLDRMRPPLIVAGDPIFHAGASSYAAEFRANLYVAMERYDALFLTNQRDFRIFHSHAPETLRNRIIGAPADWGLSMNTDPCRKFVFTACPNILTLYLLPVANALATEEIWIAGCDGRPLVENSYFWKHDTSVQFNDKMKDIQRAHPSFFDISYDDYYFLHCETVARWVQAAERTGHKILNMTPSYIPALARRYHRGLTATPATPLEEAIPFATRLRMRRVFLERQWRVLRQGVLPHIRAALNARKAAGRSSRAP